MYTQTIQKQLAGYSQEALEDFWGNSQVTQDEVRDIVNGDLSWGDAGVDAEVVQTDLDAPFVSDDADEGEW